MDMPTIISVSYKILAHMLKSLVWKTLRDVNSYYQALALLNTQPMLLQMMDELGITSTNNFKCWLEEEQAYLMSLTLEKEPKEETVQLEYIWKLVKLQELE